MGNRSSQVCVVSKQGVSLDRMGTPKGWVTIWWKPVVWAVKKIHLRQSKGIEVSGTQLERAVGRTAGVRLRARRQGVGAIFKGGRGGAMVTYGFLPILGNNAWS